MHAHRCTARDVLLHRGVVQVPDTRCTEMAALKSFTNIYTLETDKLLICGKYFDIKRKEKHLEATFCVLFSKVLG